MRKTVKEKVKEKEKEKQEIEKIRKEIEKLPLPTAFYMPPNQGKSKARKLTAVLTPEQMKQSKEFEKQLKEQGKAPEMKKGGEVKKTTYVKVHRGEYVIPEYRVKEVKQAVKAAGVKMK